MRRQVHIEREGKTERSKDRERKRERLRNGPHSWILSTSSFSLSPISAQWHKAQNSQGMDPFNMSEGREWLNIRLFVAYPGWLSSDACGRVCCLRSHSYARKRNNSSYKVLLVVFMCDTEWNDLLDKDEREIDSVSVSEKNWNRNVPTACVSMQPLGQTGPNLRPMCNNKHLLHKTKPGMFLQRNTRDAFQRILYGDNTSFLNP